MPPRENVLTVDNIVDRERRHRRHTALLYRPVYLRASEKSLKLVDRCLRRGELRLEPAEMLRDQLLP